MDRSASVGIAAAGVAIVCCAGLPLVAGVLGGLAITTLLGVGGAVLAVALVGTALAFRLRRRRPAGPRRARLGGGERR
jgi:hypothetical protein